MVEEIELKGRGTIAKKRVSGLSALNERPMRASKSPRVLVLASDARRAACRSPAHIGCLTRNRQTLDRMARKRTYWRLTLVRPTNPSKVRRQAVPRYDQPRIRTKGVPTSNTGDIAHVSPDFPFHFPDDLLNVSILGRWTPLRYAVFSGKLNCLSPGLGDVRVAGPGGRMFPWPFDELVLLASHLRMGSQILRALIQS